MRSPQHYMALDNNISHTLGDIYLFRLCMLSTVFTPNRLNKFGILLLVYIIISNQYYVLLITKMCVKLK